MELVDDPGRPAIADPHLPLEQRRRPALVLQAVLRGLAEHLVPIGVVAGLRAARILGLLGPDERQNVGLGLFGHFGRPAGFPPGLEPGHHAFGLLGADEGALDPHRLALAGRQEQHVAVPQQGLGAVLIQDRPAVHLRGDSERDPAREVGFDEPGQHVHGGTLGGENQMDPDRPGFLGQHGQRRFHFGGHRHHQVGQLIHHDHDIGHHALGVLLRGRRLGCGGLRLSGQVLQGGPLLNRIPERLPFVDLPVEVGDVAGAVGVEQLVAPVHLVHRPLEDPGGVIVVGDDLVTEMGQVVVHREFDHLRIHHQKPEMLGGVFVDQAADDRVDGHRLAGARGPRDQQVGHLGQIGDHRLALEVAA